jgi:hypothetical protein
MEKTDEVSKQGRVVVLHTNDDRERISNHEIAVQNDVAKKLAALKYYAFTGHYDPTNCYPQKLYFVPATTLAGSETARALGIRSEHDLFGGVVPYRFTGTKAITHPLVHSGAFAPRGWSHGFACRVRQVTLFGYSSFTLEDARHAGALVLDQCPARVKPAHATGGRGQTVVSSIDELDQFLGKLDPAEVSNHGVVIEQNLDRVTTLSVGQVRVADLVVTYYGKQRLTKDNNKHEVYGGTDLVVVRGGYKDLLQLVLSPAVRLAILQARAYDTAADAIPGFIASRRNYDIAQGLDQAGRQCSGVLEQSWRIGGASTAELAALEKFRADSTLRVVRASSIEAYGSHEIPPNAVVHFCGIEEGAGAITNYSLVKPHADPF